MPVAVIEIKPPQPVSIATEEYRSIKCNVFHQIADQMLAVREAFGVEHVFGLVCTYAETCVCWFEDTEKFAHSNDVRLFPIRTPYTSSEPPSSPFDELKGRIPKVHGESESESESENESESESAEGGVKGVNASAVRAANFVI